MKIRINDEIHDLEITRIDASYTRFDMTSDMLGETDDWKPLVNDDEDVEWEAVGPSDIDQFVDWLRDVCARENSFDVFYDGKRID